MKLRMLGICTVLAFCLSFAPASVLAAATVVPTISLDAFAVKVQGDSVTIHGKSNLTIVNVEVLKPDSSILYFSARTVVNGEFIVSITLPSDAPAGLYKVAVGQNTTVAEQGLNVISKSAYQSIPKNSDNNIGINTIIPFIMGGGIDLNNDGVFDRKDILLVLQMIPPISN